MTPTPTPFQIHVAKMVAAREAAAIEIRKLEKILERLEK